jgi:hypothetical protein
MPKRQLLRILLDDLRTALGGGWGMGCGVADALTPWRTGEAGSDGVRLADEYREALGALERPADF